MLCWFAASKKSLVNITSIIETSLMPLSISGQWHCLNVRSLFSVVKYDLLVSNQSRYEKAKRLQNFKSWVPVSIYWSIQRLLSLSWKILLEQIWFGLIIEIKYLFVMLLLYQKK